jgi:hypothetical protein
VLGPSASVVGQVTVRIGQAGQRELNARRAGNETEHERFVRFIGILGGDGNAQGVAFIDDLRCGHDEVGWDSGKAEVIGAGLAEDGRGQDHGVKTFVGDVEESGCWFDCWSCLRRLHRQGCHRDRTR